MPFNVGNRVTFWDDMGIAMKIKDVQSQRDTRNIPIDKVGIKNLRYPVTVRDRREGRQATVASINMYVDLPHEYKGTHMSRFVEMLHLLKTEVSLKRFSTGAA